MLDRKETPVAGDLPTQVAARIRAARTRQGLTLLQIAQRCKTTPQTMQRLETANMTLSVEWIERISKALGIEPGHLFDGTFDLPHAAILAMRENTRSTLAQLDAFVERAGAFKETMQTLLEQTK